jgi:hypothetical protein
MSGKVIITTPFPTPEEIAAFYKIPPKRVAELNRMIEEIRAADASKRERKKNARRNGGRKSSNVAKTARSKK